MVIEQTELLHQTAARQPESECMRDNQRLPPSSAQPDWTSLQGGKRRFRITCSRWTGSLGKQPRHETLRRILADGERRRVQFGAKGSNKMKAEQGRS